MLLISDPRRDLNQKLFLIIENAIVKNLIQGHGEQGHVMFTVANNEAKQKKQFLNRTQNIWLAHEAHINKYVFF